MSYKEYKEELYNAVDKVKEAFWLDYVVDDLLVGVDDFVLRL